MIRFLHLLAITGLIGSAGYAYSIKYETLYYAETLTKLKAKLNREKEGIAVAKAEWALLTRPERLQKIAEKHLDLQPMQIGQLARIADLPTRHDRGDEIAKKLELLGVDTTASLPKDKRAPDSKPVAAAKPAAAAKPVVRQVRMDEIAKKMEALGLDKPRGASKGPAR